MGEFWPPERIETLELIAEKSGVRYYFWHKQIGEIQADRRQRYTASTILSVLCMDTQQRHL